MDRYLMQAQTGREIQPKTILLVRHGQSEHNAHIYRHLGADLNDSRYIDAPLTEQGKQQAHFISPQIEQFKPQLIVASPMTRAIQTAKFATSSIQHLNIPFQITSLCSERMAYSCDIGSPISEQVNKFPDLDFSQVPNPDTWWWTKDEVHLGIPKSQQRTLQLMRRVDPGVPNDGTESDHDFSKRINEFRNWLLTREENRIVVFAHGVFLYNFVGAKGPGFSNCDTREIVL